MLSVVRITLKLRYRGANGIGRSFQAVLPKLPENENQSISKIWNSSILVYQKSFSILQRIFPTFTKIPSEMEVEQRYTLLTLLTLFILFKRLYTAWRVTCMPICIVWEGRDAIGMGWWASEQKWSVWVLLWPLLLQQVLYSSPETWLLEHLRCVLKTPYPWGGRSSMIPWYFLWSFFIFHGQFSLWIQHSCATPVLKHLCRHGGQESNLRQSYGWEKYLRVKSFSAPRLFCFGNKEEFEQCLLSRPSELFQLGENGAKIEWSLTQRGRAKKWMQRFSTSNQGNNIFRVKTVINPQIHCVLKCFGRILSGNGLNYPTRYGWKCW